MVREFFKCTRILEVKFSGIRITFVRVFDIAKILSKELIFITLYQPLFIFILLRLLSQKENVSEQFKLYN